MNYLWRKQHDQYCTHVASVSTRVTKGFFCSKCHTRGLVHQRFAGNKYQRKIYSSCGFCWCDTDYLTGHSEHTCHLFLPVKLKTQCKAGVPIALDSSSSRWIFAGCLFFEICSSSADFLDLEQCRKPSSGHMTIAARRLFGRWPIFWPNGQNFQPMPWRWPPGILSIAAGRKWIPRLPAVHRLMAVRWSAGVLPMCFWFNFSTRFCNFQCF